MEHSAAIAAPPSDVNSVHALLEQVWRDEPQVKARDRLCFETALIELASNVISHGDAGCGVRFRLAVRVTRARIEADLSDDADDPGLDADAPTMPDAAAESGRGLAMIGALVDELTHSRTADGNTWHLARTLTGAPA